MYLHYTVSMRVLLAFATYSSGTDLASQVVANVLTRGTRHSNPPLAREGDQRKKSQIVVERKDIREVSPESLSWFDLIIFASPSWRTKIGDGSPHEFFLDFMEKASDKKLPEKKFAIFGLGDSAYTRFCGAVDHLEAFAQKLGGQLLLPSLRIDGFYFNQRTHEERLTQWGGMILNKLQE